MTQNESPFRIAVEAPDACQRVIKVQVPRTEFDREYRDRLAEAVRGHVRPGFRKGKTPRATVERELGERLRIDAFEALVPRAYRTAIVEHGMFPLTDPQLENMVFEEGQDLSFDLTIEVRPEVEARDYQNLSLREIAVEVKDGEVDEIVSRLRESRAWFEKVDRAAASGDQVTVDVTPLGDDGELLAERTIAKQQLVLGSEQNLPAFNEGLLGAEAGQERTIVVAYPEDYPNPEVRGRSVSFRCVVHDVRRKVLPEVDDAFANQLEEGQTLLELRVRIRERITQEAERRVAAEMDEQVLNALIERHDVPVPPSMLEDYLRAGVGELHERNTQLGRQSSDEEDAHYREAARPVAEKVIRGLFLLESVRRQENIHADEAEVDDRIAVIAAENGFDLEKFRTYVERGDERTRIRRELEERKTYDFLLSRAQILPEASGE
jgi:trigger factor